MMTKSTYLAAIFMGLASLPLTGCAISPEDDDSSIEEADEPGDVGTSEDELTTEGSGKACWDQYCTKYTKVLCHFGNYKPNVASAHVVNEYSTVRGTMTSGSGSLQEKLSSGWVTRRSVILKKNATGPFYGWIFVGRVFLARVKVVATVTSAYGATQVSCYTGSQQSSAF